MHLITTRFSAILAGAAVLAVVFFCQADGCVIPTRGQPAPIHRSCCANHADPLKTPAGSRDCCPLCKSPLQMEKPVSVGIHASALALALPVPFVAAHVMVMDAASVQGHKPAIVNSELNTPGVTLLDLHCALLA